MPARCSSLTMPLNSSSTPCGSWARRIRRVRGEEPQRVVAPVVRQPAPEHLGLGGERLHGQQLDGGDAEPGEVLDGDGVGQPRVGAAEVVGDARAAVR